MDQTTAAATTASESSAFPVPFTLEAFRKDIANVFLHHLRTVAWMTDIPTAEAIVPGLAQEQDRYNLLWEADAEDIGLTYERLRHTTLMTTLERLYQYAFFGELDASAPPMEDESVYTWTTALVYDAAHGRLALEWSDNGSFTDKAADRCLMVCELANARNTLEGGESFYFKFGNYGKESATDFGCLTIRQMALLAGMEEMSIRAAANKKQKRANPLETKPGDNGGTRIALDVAKAWLISKGRYVPITVRWSNADIDLAKTRFNASADLWQALQARFRTRCETVGEGEMEAGLERIGLTSIMNFLSKHLKDVEKAKQLAGLLDWPADLFALRCMETAMREELVEVEHALKEAAASATQAGRA